VRRALAASIDRESISRKLTFGRYPVVDTAQPIGSWARDPAVREPGYDPAAADRLFDAAGWKRGADGTRARNGVPLALTYVQFPESQTGVRVATVVQSELAARGLRVTIKSLSNVQLFLPRAQGGVLATGAFDLAYVPWQLGADPDDSFLFDCTGSANAMRWCDPGVEALERRALIAPTRDDRKHLYSQIEHRVAAAVPIVYLFDASYSYAYRTRLRNFYPNAFTTTWNAYQWRLSP
jgi:peptide/nickel transport system substrate-binding protein